MSKLNSQTVVRQLDANIWIFSTPFTRFNLLPFGGRSTAIKLKTGGLWVVASTPLNEVTKKKLDELGSVKYIIAPDSLHHMFLTEFKDAYPDAKLIGVGPLVKRYEGKLKFDGTYGSDSPGTKYGYEDEIQSEYFDAHQNKDVAFFHSASKTLIEADLLFNLPAIEQYSKSPTPWFFSRIVVNPSNSAHRHLLKMVTTDEASMRKSANTVAKWDFERIIPCHGEVIERDGNTAWREAYKFFID